MTSDRSASNKSVVFKPPSARDYIERQLPLRSLNEEIMDVAFVKAVGCTQYAGGCDGLRKDHRFDDPVPLGENWRHKYLIDIDGMGYSARFFALLMSQSAVLKATVYTEFYSDWIQPRCVPGDVPICDRHPLTRLLLHQAPLHSYHELVQGDLQPSCLLFRPFARHVGGHQR